MADLGRRDRELASQLAAGLTVSDAEERAGVSERTAFRRLESAEFKTLVTRTRSAMFDQGVGRLASGAADAAGTLVGLATDAASDGVKLAAAKAILEAGIRWRDGVEFERRLARL